MNPRKTPRTGMTGLTLILTLLLSPLAATAASGRRLASRAFAPPAQTTQPQRPAPQQPAGQTPAATPPPAPQDGGDEVVRITANLVQLDVTVTDRQGRPVTDLKPEDFEVVVDGRRQAVTELSFVSTDAGTVTTERGPNRCAAPSRSSPTTSGPLRRACTMYGAL
jgi:hypothetical protein